MTVVRKMAYEHAEMQNYEPDLQAKQSIPSTKPLL
jgi:hypothetical protein